MADLKLAVGTCSQNSCAFYHRLRRSQRQNTTNGAGHSTSQPAPKCQLGSPNHCDNKEMSLQVSKTPPSEQSRLWRTRAFSSESGVTSRSSRCFMCVCGGGWCVVLSLWCEALGFLFTLLQGERNSLNSTTVVATGLSLWSRPGCAPGADTSQRQ